MATIPRKCKGCSQTVWTLEAVYSCGACDGRGIIFESIPVKDALVDAETLRELVLGVDAAAWDAGYIGEHYAGFAIRECSPAAARKQGVYAARAAFRACPGLRG